MRYLSARTAKRVSRFAILCTAAATVGSPLGLLARPAALRTPIVAAVVQTSDDALISRGYLADPKLADALDALLRKRAAGEPFAIQEIEILDAWEAGLPIAKIEADVLISRGIDQVFMRGIPARKLEHDLVQRWRTYATEHAPELQARNLKLNEGIDVKVAPPDSTREWELYSDPSLFNQLSSAYQNRLERKYGHKGRVRRAAAKGVASPSITDTPTNVAVNNRTADLTTQDTQSETAIVLGSGTTVLSSFNDSGSDLAPNASFTGIARSTDGGATFTDQGRLPASAVSDAGDPVFARSISTGTAVLATLAFNDGNKLDAFRTTNDGSSYSAPVDPTAGTTSGSHDKEWIVCDNFAGTGQGNFYLFWRDFGTGNGMTVTRSTTDGTTWGNRQVIASGGQGAFPVVGADHALYCFWLNGTTIVMRKSTDQGITFGATNTVATLTTTGTNGDLGLVGGFRTNAFPQVVCDPNNANRLYAVFDDVGQAVGDKADVYIVYSTDGGTTWSPKRRVNTDNTTTDQWQPCIAITPDGSSFFVSWYDRRGNGTQIGVYGVDGFACGDSSPVFTPDYAISDGTWPVVIGQDPVIVTTYMGDYDQATADNSGFYRQWGDNRLSNLSHTNQPDVRFAKVPKSPPSAFVPIFSTNGAALVSESCTPANNAIDPGELVTFSFGLKNTGGTATSNLVGTLQATGGVTSPSMPQTYGVIANCGGTGVQNFSFVASGACGGTITATLQLQDGATNLGTVVFTFVMGVSANQTFTNSSAITINDNAAATPYPSNITVSGVGAYTRVTLKLNGLSHTFPDDIDIIVVAPGGQKAYVMSDAGGSGDVSNINLTFDDTAATTIPDGGPLTPGTYKPTDVNDGTDTFPAPAPAGPYDTTFANLSSLGAAANGTWSLYVRDDASQDVGSISGGWTLTFVNPNVCSTSCPVVNQPPTANAGPDTSASSCTVVMLNGGASSDPDGGPSPLTYSWSQTAGPTVVINGATTSTPTFEAPNVASSAMLTFQLIVSDGAAMAMDSVTITDNHVAGVHVDTVGLFTTGGNTFFLRNCNGPGPADITSSFGVGGYVPIRGDWDGNGTDTEGVYDPATANFFLRNSNTPGNADIVGNFGPTGAIPVVGDWDGNGSVTVGIYVASTGTFFLRNSNTPGPADLAFTYGPANATPLVGDWDGNGSTTVGIYNSASGAFFLRNSNSPGAADIVFTYGPGGAGVTPIVGDWDGMGGDSVGIYVSSTSAFFLKNTNASGGADIVFTFGVPASYTPIAGNWDGI